MKREYYFIFLIIALCAGVCSCKNDSYKAGSAVLDESDKIIVLADTFEINTRVEAYEKIQSEPDSFLLGEMETDYGLLRARILTQLACPVGYHYPENAEIDSVCLFMYYASWVGNGRSPLAMNAYLMDKSSLEYQRTYYTNIDVDQYCSRDSSVLENRLIVAAAERLDTVRTSDGKYVPMLRMKLNEDFTNYFSAIKSFESQEEFNKQFKGLLIETSFGSSTVLNISDIALGVYYHFSYSKNGKDTVVDDMKAFYANSEVRTVNQITYIDIDEWVDQMRQDSMTHNYVVSPAGVYTRVVLPIKEIVDTINMRVGGIKRPYVNMAELKLVVDNMTNSSTTRQRNDWLTPTTQMMLIKESSMEDFFSSKDIPSDTCAIVSSLISMTNADGVDEYYYTFDLAELLTVQLRRDSVEKEMQMLLVPVTAEVATNGTAFTSAKEEQTISATRFNSPDDGLFLKMVFSGF